MKLQLEYDSDVVDTDSIIYIIDIIRQEVLLNLNVAKLNVLQNYINEKKLFFNKSTTYINLQNVIHLGLKYITYSISDKYITFEINPFILMPNTNAKLVDICKFIEFGALDVNGLYIFTKAFSYIKDSIGML